MASDGKDIVTKTQFLCRHLREQDRLQIHEPSLLTQIVIFQCINQRN